LCKKNPLNSAEIMKFSEKWEKITAKAETKWPKEGTFDVAVCEEMEIILAKYKSIKSRKKQIERREREEIVLSMFKKEGENWRQKQKTEREKYNQENKIEPTPLKTHPPPYTTGLYPLISGTVEFSGEVAMDVKRKEGQRTGFGVAFACGLLQRC